MTLIVQDDTGLVEGANAYVSVEDFRAYQDARARKYLDDDDTIAAALIRATDYVDSRFHYLGKKLNARLQALQWPRMSCYDRDRWPVVGVPQEVKDATCEYALRSMTTELALDPTQQPNGRVIKTVDTVGPINSEVEYEAGAVAPLPRYPAADLILKRGGFVIQGGSLIRG